MSKNSGIRKFVAGFDMHFGWEYRYERGVRKIAPTHDLQVISVFMEFVKDFKPDVFILGGDQLNCGPVSHWNNGKPYKIENLRLKDEMDLLNRHVLQKLEDVPKKVWLYGNHSAHILQHIESNPGVAGLLEPENYLRLRERGWIIYSQGEIHREGKLNFIHGDTIKPGANKARRLVEKYRRNIRCGHFHTYEAHTDVTAYDATTWNTAIIVPALAKVNPAYMKNAPSSHQTGFLYGWVAPDGSFTDHVMTIVRGKFLWNGKVYGA